MAKYHDPKPTTNVASGWREAKREVTKQVRIAETNRERQITPRREREDDDG